MVAGAPADNSPNDAFLEDLCLDGCVIQVGTENQVAEAIARADVPRVRGLLAVLEDSNVFFLGGVRADRGKDRARDEDILRKNYVYFDFDVRKDNPGYTDADILEAGRVIRESLADHPLYSHWRYIVFTGNGLHLYYVAAEGIPVDDRAAWKLGMQHHIEELEKLTLMRIDRACTNPARLARLPGSRNCKTEDRKDVRIVAAQDAWSEMLQSLEMLGQLRRERMEEETRSKAEAVKTLFPLEMDTYKAIQALPIAEVACRVMGWTTDGKHFFAPGSTRKSACFVADEGNFLVHGGTRHLPDSAAGYRPFEFVKAARGLENGAVFRFFRAQYPEIEAAARREYEERERKIRVAGISAGDVSLAFDELEHSDFEQLLTGVEGFDRLKFLIRGSVTRIGAFSNIGKSKLAYYLAHLLLKSGYRGIIVSTEVPRRIVLANMLTIQTGQHFWDIVEKRYVPGDGERLLYRNLEIYDVNHTRNELPAIEAIVGRSCELARERGEEPPAFLIVDFCQGIVPGQRADGEYQQMSLYAFAIQTLAQKSNVMVLDLSQISNEGVRDEFARVGFIPFKGSGHLYSSADVGIILKRDNKMNREDPFMQLDIRKHKYASPESIQLSCDFVRGTFTPFGEGFMPGGNPAPRPPDPSLL